MALSFCARHLSPLRRNIHLSRRKQQGYIVLVPEIGEDSPDRNPLLRNDGLPEFNNLTIENCMAAIAKQTLDFEEGVSRIEELLKKTDCTDIFNDVFKTLEEIGTPLDMTWGLSKTLYLGNSSLMPTKNYLAIHERAKRARASKFSNLAIYNAIKNEFQKENSHRNDEETRVMKKFLLEGKLNGLELNDKGQVILAEHLNKLADEKLKFKQKTEISTMQFRHTVSDGTQVRDFPVDLLKLISPDPNIPFKGPWKLTLQPHIYVAAMENCPDREIRWNLWQALVSRGSLYRDRELATSINVEEIRFVRNDIARLLGYDSFGQMSMETKMAGSINTVQDMLHKLLAQARPAQELELKLLYEFASQRGFKSDRLQLWDVPYWRKKQQKSVFGYSEEAFKDYFPFSKVLEGLFLLCERLFNIVIKQRSDVPTWHKDVKYFDIFEPHSSAPVAGFYLDPYVRSAEKGRLQSNGWMVAIQNRSRVTNTIPLAALVFNFDPPAANKQSYLSFKDVKSLFHKFGHALQHLLTRTNYSEVAGLSNVEWDAVDISGHVLTHWLFTKSTMDSISSHCDSEDKLPPDMFKTLMKVQAHMAGLDLSRELYLAALDLELHTSKDFWLDIVKRLWPEYRDFPLDKYDSHPCSFSQVFTEEWAAAYYSHIWSRMIAADIYSAFFEIQDDEEQIKEVAKRYRDTFLALGGSCHPSQIFRQFRGRDPSHKALLSSLGLKKKNNVHI